MIDNYSTVNSLLEKYGISTLLNQESITDIYINQPYEIFIETLTEVKRFDKKELSFENLQSLAKALCIANNLRFSESFIHAVELPNGDRGQIVLPPAVPNNTIAFAIRKLSGENKKYSYQSWLETGRLSNFIDISNNSHDKLKKEINLKDFEMELIDYKNKGDLFNFFKLAIERKLNIVTVGGTGAGKTTFSGILTDFIPPQERIITLEDVHELNLPKHTNKLHLLYKEGQITAKELLFACMRLKPDRILITEIRSDIAWDYLTALNTGHPGGITSIHANSAIDVFNRFATLAKESEVARNLDYKFLLDVTRATIDIVLFFHKTFLKEIYYDPYLKYLSKEGR
ncbi:MAG: P-type DNA transfer ATPase VirB11 [Neisseriaceae bacterium]|nr:P-type DNA transfer ATPase VirB11 [Neisseriaceae bacterium]